jgi:hypothetical protein
MKDNLMHIVAVFLLLLMFPILLQGQNWKFVKEKDGVLLYTCQKPGNGLKLFKGVAEIKAPTDKIFAKLENVNNTDWWTKDVTQIKILTYEKNKLAQYYLVYNLPWPFKNRDLCVNVTTTIDHSIGEYKLTAVPLSSSKIAISNEFVRINDYWQEWKVSPIDKNKSHVELEFYINPGTNLPNWLVNMVLSDSPINVINAMRNSL